MSHSAWTQQAQSDLAAAKVLSAANHHCQAVWLAGQAVEKAHKAILAALGLRYEDKHYKQLGHGTGEISRLLPATLHDPIDPQIARMVAALEARALASRYPAPAQTAGKGTPQLVAPAASVAASDQDVADAQQLLDWCQDRVARALRASEAMKPPPAK